MQNYLKLLSFLKDHKKIFSLAVITLIISSLFEGFQLSLLVPITDIVFTKKKIIPPSELPSFIMDAIDYLNAMSPQEMLYIIPLAILPLFVMKHLALYSSQYLMNEVAQRITRDVRYKLFDKIQNFSLDYFSAKRTGELISRITYDVQIIENAVSYGVTDLFRQFFMIIVYIAIACSILPMAAIAMIALVVLIGYPISRIGKKLRKLATKSQERMADINSIILETVGGIRVVKAFCSEQFETKRFREKNHDFYKLRMKTVKRTLFITPISELAGLICGTAIVLWMGQQIINDKMSFGMFVLFFGSIMSIINPIKKLGNVNAITQQALSANERIYKVLDEMATVQEKSSAIEMPSIKKNIVLSNVVFKYDEESDDVIKGVDLEIKAGELVAIVGPTGTGKSTLVNLIPRFYDPLEGSVKIDGVDVKGVTFKSLRSQIGIVSQETFLFNDTVKANIAYGSPDTSQSKIEEAAERAYAHRFIAAMPDGYDTVVGDRGFRLSGGEKQRIAIARAILKNPPILILDEATSQLDSESEKFVHEALDDLMAGRTVIAIAHRLSTIQKADKIVVLENGRIVGQGKHEDLLETCSLYKRLYTTQFQV